MRTVKLFQGCASKIWVSEISCSDIITTNKTTVQFYSTVQQAQFTFIQHIKKRRKVYERGSFSHFFIYIDRYIYTFVSSSNWRMEYILYLFSILLLRIWNPLQKRETFFSNIDIHNQESYLIQIDRFVCKMLSEDESIGSFSSLCLFLVWHLDYNIYFLILYSNRFALNIPTSWNNTDEAKRTFVLLNFIPVLRARGK